MRGAVGGTSGGCIDWRKSFCDFDRRGLPAAPFLHAGYSQATRQLCSGATSRAVRGTLVRSRAGIQISVFGTFVPKKENRQIGRRPPRKIVSRKESDETRPRGLHGALKTPPCFRASGYSGIPQRYLRFVLENLSWQHVLSGGVRHDRDRQSVRSGRAGKQPCHSQRRRSRKSWSGSW
jgi:hypothetical protein